MTDLLYQTDSYLQIFEARVTALDEEGRGIALDRSAFYPGGGGQPADSGELRAGGITYTVKRARKAGDLVYHYVEGEDPLPLIGAVVQGQIDWDRRYKLMRTHTALHLLCGVVFRDYGASVTGGDMDPLDGRMDFEFETLTRDLVAVIEEAVDREVQAARELLRALSSARQVYALYPAAHPKRAEAATQLRDLTLRLREEAVSGGRRPFLSSPPINRRCSSRRDAASAAVAGREVAIALTVAAVLTLHALPQLQARGRPILSARHEVKVGGILQKLTAPTDVVAYALRPPSPIFLYYADRDFLVWPNPLLWTGRVRPKAFVQVHGAPPQDPRFFKWLAVYEPAPGVRGVWLRMGS